MKIPFLTQSGEQPAPVWQPIAEDYVRFRAFEPIPTKSAHVMGPLVQPADADELPEKPPDTLPDVSQVPLALSEILEPFRDSIGVITKVYRESYHQGYVMVAFIPEDVELEDVIRDSEDLRRYFHLPIRLLEKTTLVDQETKDMFEAISDRLDQEETPSTPAIPANTDADAPKSAGH